MLDNEQCDRVTKRLHTCHGGVVDWLLRRLTEILRAREQRGESRGMRAEAEEEERGREMALYREWSNCIGYTHNPPAATNKLFETRIHQCAHSNGV